MILKIHNRSRFKEIIFILQALALGLLFIIPPHLSGQDTGYKFLKNYSYLEYDHHPQNWGMTQAKNGIIYVANNAGVLEFDGVSWRPIGIPIYATARSLSIDETGTVYIGGKGEIGCLAPDEKGTLKYNSLLDYLPDDKKISSDVWKTYTTKKGIYFQTSKFLVRWDSRQMKVWEPVESFHFSFLCKGKLFIRQRNVGLMQMVNDSLELVPGGEMFAAKKIYMLVLYNSMNLLIGTESEGFYLYDGTTVRPFPTEADDYLKRNKLYHGIRLSSGDFALATRGGGLVIMAPHGRIKHIFNKTYGLQDEMVYYVFEDVQRNLWLCLNDGISKIEYASPISIYDERSHLPGMVLSVVKHHNKIYVGTIKELYYLESPLKFHPIPRISGSCWNLCSIDDSLLAATSAGVFQVKMSLGQKIIETPSYVLLPSRYHPGRTWCGTRDGLVALFRENGQWREEHRFEIITQGIRSIIEDKKRTLWLGTLTGNVFKVEFGPDIRHPVVTRYDDSHGLPDGDIYAAWAAGHVIFATPKGLFRFDEKKKKFVPDETLGPEFAGGLHSKPVFRLVEDKNQNIWFHSDSRNYRATPRPGKSFKIDSQPFRRIPPNVQVNAIYPDPDGKTAWFASHMGLICFDTTVKKNYRQYFQTMIRKVLVKEKQTNEKLIFDGQINNSIEKHDNTFPVFEYKDRNLYFAFAAPFFEAENATRYQCFLEGYDGNWSTWNKENRMNYTNLDSGLYTFRVRAKNVYQHMGDEDVFRFKILPPWYKTWWAFSFYVIGSLLSIFLVVKWRSSRLEQEKQKLENIVKERTKEINEKTQQLEEQSEKLKEMDQVKSRFFTNISHEFRTPLTLIMSPLEQMLSQDRDKEQKKELNVMLRNSQRLLTLINQLLDLSRIDSGTMRLQAGYQNIVPFLKEITDAFRGLALQNRLNMEFIPAEEDIPLYFDAPKIEEVMYNLLINAIKFTPAGGRITVSVSKQENESPGFVNMSVQDTGIGIPEAQLEHIFDRFYQAKTLKEKGHRGTGIGLALVKELVILHHGEIGVNSREGEGTQFVIQLPLGRECFKFNEIVAVSGMEPDRKRQKEVERLYMLAQEADSDSEEEDEDIPIDPDAEPGEEEKNVILVVEDHADVRKYIRKSLEPHYKVVEAGDGKKGIEKAREIIPDLIVSDIMMPEKDGYELCRELKKDVKTSHIPIILLTAKASEESAVQGLETGANDYITKPFNTKILLSRIKNLMDLRRQLQLRIQREKLLLPAEIPVSPVDEEFFKEFQDIIEKNLSDEDFNIDILCKKLYMGRATLFRKIKALTGETPNQFILSYRLERAAQLFREDYGNVSEVSAAVGFATSQYFARCFKEKFHQTPKSYRASHGSKGSKKNPPGKKK